MAMLFSEQQPKQVHKAHLQQSMCQAMELVEHTSMGGLPQPGAFSDPQKPLKDFYKQPGLFPRCAAPHPQMCPGDGAHTWQTPAADLPSARLHQSGCPTTCPHRGGGTGVHPWLLHSRTAVPLCHPHGAEAGGSPRPGVVLGAGNPS